MILKFFKICLYLTSFLFLTGFVQIPAVMGPAITIATSGNLAKATAQLVFDYEFKKKTGKSSLNYISEEVSKNNKENFEKSEKIYKELKKQNIDVLLDDVDENMSNKFKKHDLIGVPYQIIVGSKSRGDNYEFKELGGKSEILDLNEIKSKIKN